MKIDFAAVIGLTLLAACSSEPMPTAECEFDAQCPPGMYCNARGRCERTTEEPAPDASLDLAMPIDAAPNDAGVDAEVDAMVDAEAPLDAESDAPYVADASGDAEALDGSAQDAEAHLDLAMDMNADATIRCWPNEFVCNEMCVTASVAIGTNGRDDISFTNCGDCENSCDSTKASACSIAASATTPACMCGTAPPCSDARVCYFTSGAFRCIDPSTIPDGGTPDLGAAGMCGSTMCRPPSGSDLGEICCGESCVVQNNDNCGACGNVCPSTFDADEIGIDPAMLSALCLTAGDFASIARCTADPSAYFFSSVLGGGPGPVGVGCGMGSSSVTGDGPTSICCQTAGICIETLRGGGLPFP